MSSSSIVIETNFSALASRAIDHVTICRFQNKGLRRRFSRNVTGLFVPRFITRADLVAHLKNDGFRLLTSDEWEYLCGGGIATLFRWGDHAPCDRYPTDISREEIEWRTEWVRSSGKLERPVGGFTSDWDYHRLPNSLGLLIAQNPYQSELVNEPGVLRGGDGGCSICGGIGYFAG